MFSDGVRCLVPNEAFGPHHFCEMDLFLSLVALVFGVFIVVSPARAAQIWGWEHLGTMPARRRALYMRAFRAMGFVIALAGVLFELDHVLSP